MKDALTPSALRKDIYNVLDEVLETGEPRAIQRRGRTVWLVLREPRRGFRIGQGPALEGAYEGTFDDLVATTWENAWAPDDDASAP